MTSSHPVRIARAAGPGADPGSGPRSRATYRPNTDGARRASRLFAVFTLGLVVCYGVFVGLASRASGGLSADPGAFGLLTGVAGLLVAGGLWLTLGRTPRGVWVGGDQITIDVRWRPPRRFRVTGETPWTVVQRFPGTPWFGGPTEIVRFRAPSGRGAEYLLDAGLLEGSRSAA